jgi:hypothetical protein
MGTTHIYVDRGDPSSHDWTVGNFTTDYTWRDLDCSSIVPAGATAIHFRVSLDDGVVGSLFQLRENGNSNTRNLTLQRIQVANKYIDADMWCSCDSNRVVEYRGSNVTFSAIDVTIRGWIIPIASSKLTELTEDTSPANDNLLYTVKDPDGTPLERRVTVPNLMGLVITNPSDNTGWDFTKTDFTTDGTWRDLDLSSLVPLGATHVLIRLAVEATSVNWAVHLRGKGSSSTVGTGGARSQVSGVVNENAFIVPCDSSRVIQYSGTNGSWSGIWLSVQGWIGAGVMTTTTTTV